MILKDYYPSKSHIAGIIWLGSHGRTSGAHIVWAHLAGAHLAGVHMAGAQLVKAHMAEAHLVGGHMARALMAGAQMAGVHMAGAYYFGHRLYLFYSCYFSCKIMNYRIFFYKG